MRPSRGLLAGALALGAAALLGGLFRYDLLLGLERLRLAPLRAREPGIEEPAIFSDRVPKLWVHRVDSLERLRWLLPRFAGFEVDAVFDPAQGLLDVGHPPVPSIGLSFEDLLREKGAEGKYFWLDLKNLDSGNAAAVLRLLEGLDARYGIKRRLIVESRRPQALRTLAAAGYYTSYYLPADAAAAGLFPRLAAVSQEASLAERMARLFPGRARLTWLISTRTLFTTRRLEALYGEPGVKVILIGVRSPGFR